MWSSMLRTLAGFSSGDEAGRHFELAAERIQHALLDISVPDVSRYEFGVYAEPAMLVGGDYIDLYRCTDDVLVFGLGDASGKSLAAALNSLMLRYLMRGLAKALGPTDLVRIVEYANEVLSEDMDDGSFITFLLGTLEIESGKLCIVNAGHEPPLILSAGDDQVRTLDVHDIVLGITPITNYRAEEYVLEDGDLALFYTDGLTEATNTDGEMYTIERLKRELLSSRDLPARDLAKSLFEATKRYTNGPMRDDSTVLVVRRRSAPIA